ncbi:MAG: hypothetical protein NTW87_14490 [Planctomycetota bacterium]|nr:hypothetical protein [Planctomycetota bacterium]
MNSLLTKRWLIRTLICLAFAGTLAAACIPGLRLAFGRHGSFYTFGFVGDEYFYAQRIQPLLAGTTAGNPVNGICDPTVVSEHYLEDACRGLLTVTGLDVIVVAWAWRVVFPLLLAGAMALLAGACLKRRRPWSAQLCWAAGAAAFALIYVGYDPVTSFPPLQGWLHRFPTNIEYVLSALTALAYVRFADAPDARRGAIVALAGALLLYLRPYVALPWGIALGSGMIYCLAARRMSWRVAFTTVGILLAAMTPWLLIHWCNSRSVVYRDLMERYYWARGYHVHILWPTYVGIAAVFVLASFLAQRRVRVFFWSCALAMAAVPFISGLFTFSQELLFYERFSPFFLVTLGAAGMLSLRAAAEGWRGKAGWHTTSRWAGALALGALVAGGVVAWRNATFDLLRYKLSQYPSVVRDLPHVPAYKWICENTPPDALFIVDDGFDWSRNTRFMEDGHPYLVLWAPDGTDVLTVDDLFQLVARRRRIFTERLYVNTLSTDDLILLGYLQRGTFGLPVKEPLYYRALKKFRPTHVFWRRTAPIPRGYGARLRHRVVYTDDVCEVWELQYGDAKRK